ncbi:dephospho-CoA kinase [Hathewaya histolytica]|uniref:Dephospho-CoA kinase n=1 Tax=Hathewaya histolytica TaxID=1498 RepID=A0A4U9R7B2_HATHI|nr:dephospho-CoA kinase [Hathewaya histolytica]VTQ87392.1 dephospho-CoA kinase [Hathewaya histolytica]
MIKIGLTGGIGSGKTTISSYLLKKEIPIIDADKISREIYDIYPQLKDEIKLAFGERFFDKDNNLKRRDLGNFIFKFKKRRNKLERIVIPYIKREIFKRFKEEELKGKDICILDAPTLIENNLHKKMDMNILVYVDLKIQINRVMKRDKLTYKETLERINSQLPLKKKKKKVQYIINNNKALDETLREVDEVLKDIKQSSNERKGIGNL